jgi:UDP-N-acetylmuramate-alanine ligase
MHYHLIGICGTAMASLAGMLQSRGHKVTGSDDPTFQVHRKSFWSFLKHLSNLDNGI